MTKAEYRELLETTSLSGGFPARAPEGTTMCVYRVGREAASPGRCAAGLLIPDEAYDPNMENEMVSNLISRGRFLREWLPEGVSEDALGCIQRAHDSQVGKHVKPWDHELFMSKVDAILEAA